MAQEIGRRFVTSEAWIRFQISPCEMFLWTKFQWVGFLYQCFGFPLSVSFHQRPLFFIYMLLLRGETYDALGTSKCSRRNLERCIEKYVYVFGP
jgi:hypothetical protein